MTAPEAPYIAFIMQKVLQRNPRFGKWLLLALLLAYAGMALAGVMPHSHDSLEGEHQCPLHVFSKQAQGVGEVPAILIALLLSFSTLVLTVASFQGRESFSCALIRAPPLVS